MLPNKTIKALKEFTPAVCLKAFELSEDGNGASTVAESLDLDNAVLANQAIDAGRVYAGAKKMLAALNDSHKAAINLAMLYRHSWEDLVDAGASDLELKLARKSQVAAEAVEQDVLKRHNDLAEYLHYL